MLSRSPLMTLASGLPCGVGSKDYPCPIHHSEWDHPSLLQWTHSQTYHCLFSWASVTICVTSGPKAALTNYHQFSSFKQQHTFFSLVHLEASSSKIGLNGLKSSCWHNLTSSGCFRVESVVCLFQLLGAAGIPSHYHLQMSLQLLVSTLPSSLLVFMSNLAQPPIGAINDSI